MALTDVRAIVICARVCARAVETCPTQVAATDGVGEERTRGPVGGSCAAPPSGLGKGQCRWSRYLRPQMPDLPGAMIEFGSRASLMASWNLRSAPSPQL